MSTFIIKNFKNMAQLKKENWYFNFHIHIMNKIIIRDNISIIQITWLKFFHYKTFNFLLISCIILDLFKPFYFRNKGMQASQTLFKIHYSFARRIANANTMPSAFKPGEQ